MKTYIEAIHDGIREEMQRDERVMILGEDVGEKGGVFGVTEGLQKEFGESRVLDSPLAESMIVGVAIGASMNGMRPIAEIQFQDFIMPAVDQIISEAAKMRYRSNGDWNVPMVVRSPFGGGVHGALYHSQSIEAIFAHIPGLRVVVPSTPYDAKGMIISAHSRPGPGALLRAQARVPRHQGRGARRRLHGAARPRVHRARGNRHRGLQLRDDGAHRARGGRSPCCRWVFVRGDRPPLAASDRPRGRSSTSASKCGKVLIVQEANLAVSVSSEVAAIIAEDCFDSLDAPVMRIGGPEIPAMPYSPPLEKFYLVTPDKVEAKLRELAAY